jgi:hypothetical protein
MGQYGKAAIFATRRFLLGKALSLGDAWDFAISQCSDSFSTRVKRCPRGAYLGLCEAGLIRGIPPGDYGAPSSDRNGRYARDAYKILQSEPELADDKDALWERIPEKTAKNQNGQMDVVLTLLSARMLV